MDQAVESERLRSIGAFIWAARERVLAAGQHAGDTPERVIECRLRGASMAGAIPAGSRIRIALASGPYQVGDVVAFMDDAQVVVHRIVRAGVRRDAPGNALIITRGDAMVVPDAPIETRAVLGRISAIAGGTDWCPVGAQQRLPRRDRLLALVLLAATAATLRLHAPLAQRLARWLQASDSRYSWTRSLLY
jgi:hypothetical protein